MTSASAVVSSYAIISSDKHGTILSANQNASKLFGRAIVDLVGQNVSILMPNPFRDQHDTYLKRYHETNQPRVLGRSREVVGLHSSGAYIKLTLSLSKAESNRGTIYIAMFEKTHDDRIMIDVSKSGIINHAKGNIQLVLGYHSSELIGKNISIICPEPHASSHDKYIHNYQTTGKKKVLDRVRNLQALHKSGKLVNISLYVIESKIRPLPAKYTSSSSSKPSSSLNAANNNNDNNNNNENGGGGDNNNGGLDQRAVVRNDSDPRNNSSPNMIIDQNDSQSDTEDGYRGVITPVDDIEAMITLNHQGVILSSSDDFLQLFGYTADELIGQSIQLLLKSDISEFTSRLYAVGSFRKNVRAIHKDLSILSVNFEATRKFTEDDRENPIYVCKIVRTDQDSSSKELISEGQIMGHYSYSKVLGSGYFGKVYLAIHRLTGEKVAIKTLKKSQYLAVKMEFPPREISVLKALNHPNINKLYDLVILDDRIHMILEYVEGKDLCEIVEAAALPESLCRKIVIQVCQAIHYMHDHQVVHRDIKLENVIIDKTGTVKIIDMGFGNFIAHKNHLLRTFCGSPDYAAPELFMGKPYLGPPVDLWSLGVLIYVMIAGALPFKDSQHILSLHYSFPPNFPPGPKDLINKLLVFEPEDRLSIKDVLAHPWICGNSNTPLPPVVPNTVIDEEILLKIEEMGFSSFTVRSSLQSNEFNQFTTTYFLLQKKKERSNVGPEGKELKNAVGLNSSSTSSVETSSDTDSDDRNSNSSGSLGAGNKVPRVNKGGKKKKKEECYLI